MLIIAHWHGIVRRELALCRQVAVHVLADGAVGTISADNYIALVKAENTRSIS